MPSSAAARITRIEISPRFATSSLRTGAGETSMEFFLRGAWGTDINRARTDQPVSRSEAGWSMTAICRAAFRVQWRSPAPPVWVAALEGDERMAHGSEQHHTSVQE